MFLLFTEMRSVFVSVHVYIVSKHQPCQNHKIVTTHVNVPKNIFFTDFMDFTCFAKCNDCDLK